MAFGAQRVLVLVNLDKSDAAVFSRSVVGRLTELGIQCEVAEFSGDPGERPEMSGISLVVTLGGDGTVLYAARLASPSAIPVFPVNLGRLGFIAEIGRDDWRSSLDSWIAGDLPISARLMLSVETWRDEKLAATHIALNDAVISAQGIAKVIGLGVRVGGSLLGRYRSDGIIVATPTGSTAYNLAAGGPVLHPEMEAIAINPICPFTLSNRPLVVGAGETIEIH
ncbi:MAG: NAD(+)/NADH kinase, partial [Spirochaetaceae bacterium]|nr:NAD(+)/NADH kinase [Spirochaetaceae bacterium]